MRTNGHRGFHVSRRTKLNGVNLWSHPYVVDCLEPLLNFFNLRRTNLHLVQSKSSVNTRRKLSNIRATVHGMGFKHICYNGVAVTCPWSQGSVAIGSCPEGCRQGSISLQCCYVNVPRLFEFISSGSLIVSGLSPSGTKTDFGRRSGL